MSEPTWRVKDAAGVVHEAPPIIKREISGKPFYTCEGRGNWQSTEIAAVRWWMIPIDAREIAEPGQLFASEQVAAAFAKCRKIVWEETEYAHNVASRALEELDKMIAKEGGR